MLRTLAIAFAVGAAFVTAADAQGIYMGRDGRALRRFTLARRMRATTPALAS